MMRNKMLLLRYVYILELKKILMKQFNRMIYTFI